MNLLGAMYVAMLSWSHECFISATSCCHWKNYLLSWKSSRDVLCIALCIWPGTKVKKEWHKDTILKLSLFCFWNDKSSFDNFRGQRPCSNGKERKYIQTKDASLIMQVAIEAIYNAIQTAVYSLILYSMIGFDWKATSFFWFYYYILMCFMYFTLYGMMIVALTPGHQVAAICMSFFLSFWNLFSGFIIPRTVCDSCHFDM